MLGHGLGSWADLCDNFSFRVFIDNQEFGFSRVMNLEQDQDWELTGESDEKTYFDLEFTFCKYERKK